MRPDRIFEVLDLAKVARTNGYILNPMFTGEAGLGKSQIIQQWVKNEQKADPEFGFIDLRIAYYEGPDFAGMPYEYTDDDGNKRMGHALPHFWPTKGRGLLLLEEPNRGNTMVMNCLMQLLTDRAVGPTYKLPEGWLIASAVNPEGAKYDVNNMDTALKDRFEEFDVEYDYNTFFHHAETSKWHPKILRYLKMGNWQYKKPDSVSKDAKYISPRTWSKINAAEMSGASASPGNSQIHRIICTSILGKFIGEEYWKTCWDDAPITAGDLLKDLPKALEKLREQCKSSNQYAGDKISMTIDSIVDNYGGFYEGRVGPDKRTVLPHVEGTIDEATMAAVATIIPSDQAVNLLKYCGTKVAKGDVSGWLASFQKRYPDTIKIMRANVQVDRALNKKE